MQSFSNAGTKPSPNSTLWIISLAAIALAAVACWKAFSEGRLPNGEAGDRNAVSKPEEPTGVDAPISPPEAAASSPQRASSLPIAAAHVPNTTGTAPARLSLESTVRLPVAPIATDKNKLEAEAFSVANGLLAKRPKDSKAIHVAAVCNSQLNKTGEAQRLWLQCVELSPKQETYYLNLAANALFRGDTEFALEILEKAEANGLSSGNISHHKGLALSRLGEDERAVAVLKKAIEDKSAMPAHWMLLGQAQLKLGEYAEAKTNLLQATEQGVRNRALYVALMNAAVRLKQPEEAAKYREVVESMGDEDTTDGPQRFEVISDREARRVLISVLAEASSVYRDAKLFEDAEFLALRLLILDPTNYGICRFLADLYRDTQKMPEHIAVRERMLEIAPNDLLNYLHLARAYADAARPQKSEAVLKLGIAMAPDQAVGYAAMAEFLVENRTPAQAKWYAEQALEREPSPAGYKLLASIWRSLGKETEAQQIEKAGQAAAPSH